MLSMLSKYTAIKRVIFPGQINLISLCKHEWKKYIQNIHYLKSYINRTQLLTTDA